MLAKSENFRFYADDIHGFAVIFFARFYRISIALADKRVYNGIKQQIKLHFSWRGNMFLSDINGDNGNLGFVIVGWVVSVVICLIIKYVVAKRFESIARLKGYGREVHSFAMCFWLGFVGYFYVLALPKINTVAQMVEVRDRMAIDAGYASQCPYCKITIPCGVEECPHCHSKLEWEKDNEDEDE